MKKLFFIFFILLATSSYSQFLNKYGIKIGETVSYQTWEYSQLGNYVMDKKVGFNIGVFAEFYDWCFISFIGEINYIQKGFQEELYRAIRVNNDYKTESLLRKVRFDYINISLLVKPKINFSFLVPYLIFGPRMDFEIGKSSNYPIGDFYDDFNKNMIGLKFGVGTEIIILKYGLLLEVLYDLNIREVYKNPNLEVKASSIDFRIGVIF
ncbi:MAG: PorT family protein [Bacteroidetes bacterium]|nr:PorT family protein [Bacteroidota bacterium]